MDDTEADGEAGAKHFGLCGSRDGSIYAASGLGTLELRALALDCIDEYLGSVCAAVAEVLLRHGGLKGLDVHRILHFALRFESADCSFADVKNGIGSGIKRPIFQKLSLDLIKNALVVMIRHDVVLLDTREVEGSSSGAKSKQPLKALYRCCPTRSLMLLRHGSILDVVCRYHGKIAALLCEELLVAGSDSKRSACNSLVYRAIFNHPEDSGALAIRDMFNDHPSYDPSWEEPVEEGTGLYETVGKHPMGCIMLRAANEAWEKLVELGVIVPKQKFTLLTKEQDMEMDELSSKPTKKRVASAATANKKRKAPTSVSSSKPKSGRVSPTGSVTPQAKATEGCPELQMRLGAAIKVKAEPKNPVDEEQPPRACAKRVSKKKHMVLDSDNDDSDAKDSKNSASKLALKGKKMSDKTTSKPPSSSSSNEPGTMGFTYAAGDPRCATFYRVNWNYYLQRMRAEMIAEYWRDKGKSTLFADVLRVVSEVNITSSVRRNKDKPMHPRRDPGSGKLVDPMFMLPESSERVVNEAMVCKDLVKENCAELTNAGNTRPEAVVAAYVHTLEEISGGVVSTTGKGECCKDISVHFDDAMRLIKRRCVLKQIESEHGLEGLRIINLLLDLNALEEKDVGDLAMLDPKAARSKLYALFKSGYLIVEEASRKNDLNPSYTYYLNRVEMDKMQSVVTANTLKALLNLRTIKRKYIKDAKDFEEVKIQSDKYYRGELKHPELMRVQGVREYLELQWHIEHLEIALANLDKMCLLLTAIQETDLSVD